MDLQDLSEDDDFFIQNFTRPGFVSVWLASADFDLTQPGDALQTFCGVGYYRVDDQEANASDGEPLSVDNLIAPLSYSQSFSRQIVEAAKAKGISASRWVLAQYDFAYDPSRALRPTDPALPYIATVPYLIDQPTGNDHP